MGAIPIGQIIGIAVGVIGKATFCRDQPCGVGRGAPLIPAQRALAGELCVQFDGPGDVLCFHGFGHVLIVDPAMAVAGHFPVGGQHRLYGLRVQRHGLRHAEHGDRHSPVGKQAVQPPKAGAAAIFIEAFHRHRPGGMALRAHHFRQKGLGAFVAIEHAIFGAFLEIDDELQRYPRAARPAWVRGMSAIADQIADRCHASHAASAAATASPAGRG